MMSIATRRILVILFTLVGLLVAASFIPQAAQCQGRDCTGKTCYGTGYECGIHCTCVFNRLNMGTCK